MPPNVELVRRGPPLANVLLAGASLVLGFYAEYRLPGALWLGVGLAALLLACAALFAVVRRGYPARVSLSGEELRIVDEAGEKRFALAEVRAELRQRGYLFRVLLVVPRARDETLVTTSRAAALASGRSYSLPAPQYGKGALSGFRALVEALPSLDELPAR